MCNTGFWNQDGRLGSTSSGKPVSCMVSLNLCRWILLLKAKEILHKENYIVHPQNPPVIFHFLTEALSYAISKVVKLRTQKCLCISVHKYVIKTIRNYVYTRKIYHEDI